MCVAQTCKRRRRQAKLDKRYKRKDPIAAARRDLKKLQGERDRIQRSKKKG